MGFFDKAKNSFTERFGDEIVRRGSFGAKDDGEEDFELEEEEQEAPKAPRSKPRPRPKLPRRPKRRVEPEEEPEELEDSFGSHTVEESYYEEDFPEESFEEPASAALNRRELSKLAKNEGQSVKDVLKSMGIEETFVIDDSFLFLDEELATKQFSTQVPIGYDQGEVDFFVTQTQRSVAGYVSFLRIRNDDVVKMAQRISDLGVEINNMRFNSEVANGINIMASGDDDSLAVDLQEARARNQRLKEELDRLKRKGAPSQADVNELESLRNELAAERMDKERFEAEAQDLRAHLMLIEEEHDIQVLSDRGDFQTAGDSSGYEHYEEQRGGQFDQAHGFESRAGAELDAEEATYEKVGRDHWLPGMEGDEVEELHGYSDNGFEAPLEDELLEEGLPEDDFGFEEEGLEDISIGGDFESNSGNFSQSNSSFVESAFTPDSYQNIDEFIENNLEAFPDDNSSAADQELVGGESYGDEELPDGDDPDEDSFQYSFER